MKTSKISSIGRIFAFIGIVVLSFSSENLAAQSQVPMGLYPNKTDSLGKQGAWKKVDEQGTCVYVGQFKNDKPYGMFQYFDTDGRIMTEMNFLKEGKIAYSKMYSVTGKIQAEGKYVNQQKDSIWTFYTDDGVLLSKETYVNGKKQGKSVTYHPGTMQPAEIKFYKNGLEDSTWVQYYYDGKKEAEGTYKAGNYEGRAIWYFPDGKINIIGNYKHAVKDGKWVYYSEDDGKYVIKGTEVWKLGRITSGEEIVKPEDMNKQVDDPQDPDHNKGGDDDTQIPH